MKLRPHHLLCTQGYSGKGYDTDFVLNMTAVTEYLRNVPGAVVDIVFSTDDLCTCCPNKLGVDICIDNDKVKSFDQRVIDYFGIEEKSYIYSEITQIINSQMTELMMDTICAECNWYPISACKRNILSVSKENVPYAKR